MNARPPVPCMFKGGAFHPLGRVRAAVAQQYGDGEIVLLEEVEERSERSHDHEFAWLKDAWLSLPEAIAHQYPSREHLRKRALIATGWCDIRDHVCSSRAEAIRTAAALRGELDDYTVVIVAESVVRVCRAKSQARNRMKAADFQKSKTDILEWIAALIGVTPAQLSEARAA